MLFKKKIKLLDQKLGIPIFARTLRRKMMDKPMSNLMFQGMCFVFMLRDLFSPRETILMETGIKPGDYVLDYGCGPGGYVAPASKLLGEAGRVYALDINPLAVKRVQKIALKEQLANVETICSDCKTRLHAVIRLLFLYVRSYICDSISFSVSPSWKTTRTACSFSFFAQHGWSNSKCISTG